MTTIPYWFYLLLLLFSGLFLFNQLLKPLLRRLYHNRMLQTTLRLDEQLKYGIPGSVLNKRDTWIDRLLDDEQVKAAIVDAADERGEDAVKVHGEARKIADEILPSFNAFLYFRFGYWVARGVLRLLYWVQVGYSRGESSYSAIDRSTCVVVVSNHKSNVDPFLLIYLASRQSAVSFSAGEWARGWPLRQLLHVIGFYLIRRDDADPLYRCLLQRYVFLAVSEGVPQGLFLEGSLSQTGAIQPMHLGLLNYQLKALGSRRCRDIVFIPAAVNYDKIPEDTSLIAQQAPGRKLYRKRNRFFSRLVFLMFLFRLLPYLLPRKYKPFGYAGVEFGEPVSLNQWQHDRNLNLAEMADAPRREAVTWLAEDLANTIQGMIPVLPVPILATVLLQGSEAKFSELE